MSRALRLLDLRERLQAAAETTVGVLARDLGVSERTVRRDLATLRERGMPITSAPGPGGGVRLEGPRGLTAVHLAVEDVAALWLAARLAQAVGPLAGPVPWGRRAERVLPKLLAALPRARARALRELCARIYVGPPASDAVRAGAGTGVPELLGLVERAAFEGRALRFAYRDRTGRASERLVEPHGVLVQLPVWYLLARDAAKDTPRAFRMDRIARPALVPGHRFTADSRVVRALLPTAVPCAPLG
jgi:predicted DNA-binding transcriptional regulator YafY